MKKILLLLVALVACLTADAYSVFTYCVPNGAAEVQIGTDLAMGSSNFTDAEAGQCGKDSKEQETPAARE